MNNITKVVKWKVFLTNNSFHFLKKQKWKLKNNIFFNKFFVCSFFSKIDYFFKKKRNNIFIIKKNDDFIILNKPSGLIIYYFLNKYKFCCFLDLILFFFGDLIFDFNRCGLVSRLDRNVSGIFILPRIKKNYLSLLSSFKYNRLVKYYFIIVNNKVRKDFNIKGFISSFGNSFSISSHKNGKFSCTYFKRLSLVRINRNYYSLVICKPITGRFHQIKLHLFYLKYSIMCSCINCIGFCDKISLHFFYVNFFLFKKIIKIYAPFENFIVSVIINLNLKFLIV